MQQTDLGTTTMQVSRIALGCMGFAHHPDDRNPWTLDDAAAQPIFRRAVELGITFWDTANVYGAGTSEEIVGRAIRRFTSRKDVVIATKVGLPMHDGPSGSGLSRAAIMEQVDQSLRRLDTDYIDLYQIHRFDPATPVEETMQALHDVVTAGKVRHIGASSMPAWRFATMQHVAEMNGSTRFVSMQNQYSLLQREEEREMFDVLADQTVSSLPWCPLAKGRLARPFGHSTARSHADPMGQRFFGDPDRGIVDAVHDVASRRDVSMAQVAIAWVLANPVVAAPIVGVTDAKHLDDAVAAVSMTLTEPEQHSLTRHYTPRYPTGY